MYSFVPLPPETLYSLWFHFYIVMAAVVFLWLIKSDALSGRFKALFTACLVSGIFVVSQATGREVANPNAKVEASLVGFQAEGFEETSMVDFHTTYHHRTYVVYAVPEGRIIFPASPEVVYPQKTTLYKN